MKSNAAKPLGKDLPSLRKARAYWAAGRIADALPLFREAVEQHPRNSRALIDAARAFGNAHELADAEGYLDRAARISGGHPEVAPLIAQTFRMIYRPEKAIEAFESVRMSGKSVSPNVAFELALLYERANRTDEALDAVRDCLKKAPNYLEPKLVLARLERRAGNASAAGDLLDELAGKARHPELRARLFAELADFRDAEGEFDGAMEAIEQCKAIQKKLPKAERMSKLSVLNNEILKRIYTELTPERVAEWMDLARDFPTDERSSGIGHLIGFPRSGTTLLEQILDAHPGLVSSQERAVFSRDIFMAMFRVKGEEPLTMESLQAIPPEHLIAQRKRYLDYMEATLGSPIDGRFHLDKNPNHTSLAVGLFRLFPESRFLVALRDPRDVVVSCYLRYFTLTEFSSSFLTWGSTSLIYQFEMGVWLVLRKLFEAQQNWLEVRYEDTVTDLEKQARRALEFLGLPWDEAVRDYRSQLQNKTVLSPTHAEVREPVYTRAIGRWKNYQRHLEPYLAGLQPFVEAFGYE